MLRRLLSKPGVHHSSCQGEHTAPILNLRRCEGLREQLFDVMFIAAVRQRSLSWPSPVSLHNAPLVGPRAAAARPQDVAGWHLPTGLADISLRRTASQGGREVPVWSRKRQWESVRYAPGGESEQARLGRAGRGERGTASSSPAEPARSRAPHSLRTPLMSGAILVRCQRRFGHQGPNPLTVRCVSSLPARARR